MTTHTRFRKSIRILLVATCLTVVASAMAQHINFAPAPTGIPEVDWQNIQNGLDTMGPGETLQLAEGTYKIHRPLVFEDWNGSLIGAGPDRSATIIEVSKASNGDLFAVIYEPLFDDFDFPGSQSFGTPVFAVNSTHGLFRVADLTIDVTEIGVAERSFVVDSNNGGSIVFYIDAWENNNQSVILGSLGAEVDVVIENCSILGSAANMFYGQPNHGIQLGGELSSTVGDYTVRNCSFEGIGSNVVQVSAMHDSKLSLRTIHLPIPHDP